MKLTFLQSIIVFSIKFRVKYNLLTVYNYQVGDSVKYNWKAKIMLMPTIKDNVNDILIINEVKHKRNEFINYKNTRSKKRSWVDAYWLKKVR